jgi:hypothetical protein
MHLFLNAFLISAYWQFFAWRESVTKRAKMGQIAPSRSEKWAQMGTIL